MSHDASSQHLAEHVTVPAYDLAVLGYLINQFPRGVGLPYRNNLVVGNIFAGEPGRERGVTRESESFSFFILRLICFWTQFRRFQTGNLANNLLLYTSYTYNLNFERQPTSYLYLVKVNNYLQYFYSSSSNKVGACSSAGGMVRGTPILRSIYSYSLGTYGIVQNLKNPALVRNS